ncbi:MAG: helix-turn-helix domain-containing protein, partial [Planctomycetota bacterium]
MDKIVKPLASVGGNWHLAQLPRRYPARIRVGNIGYAPIKAGWVNNTFNSYNFSFILSGQGEYWIGDRCWPVEAPCVIIQQPGIHHRYGALEGESWEELYLIYGEEMWPALTELGFAREERYLWRIHDPGPARTQLNRLMQALQAVETEGAADRVDRICEAMVLESLLGEERPQLDAQEEAIRRIQHHLDTHWDEVHDYDELGLEAGFSPSSFRRLWARYVGPPPARYLMEQRINRACRRLMETRLSVAEIAGEVGFKDQLYFSRRFRQIIG